MDHRGICQGRSVISDQKELALSVRFSFKSGFFRLWVVVSALWVSIGAAIILTAASSTSFSDVLAVILPPLAMLAIGATCSWVLSGFLKSPEINSTSAAHTFSPALSVYLNEAMQWVYLQIVQDLRNDGCELSPSVMPDDMRTAVVQYLFGATLAIEEDMNRSASCLEWGIAARLEVLRWIIVPMDHGRVVQEGRIMNGMEGDDYSSFAVLGAGAIRNLINQCEDRRHMNMWASTYQGSFLAAARLFTNYR